MPKEHSRGRSIHQYFPELATEEFWEKIWLKDLEKCNELDEISRESQNLHEFKVKVPLVLETV